MRRWVSEVKQCIGNEVRRRCRLNADGTHPTYDLVVICEVGLAVLATVDFTAVEVDIVGEAHLECRWALGLPVS